MHGTVLCKFQAVAPYFALEVGAAQGGLPYSYGGGMGGLGAAGGLLMGVLRRGFGCVFGGQYKGTQDA